MATPTFVGSLKANRLVGNELAAIDGTNIQCLTNFSVTGSAQLNSVSATSASVSGSLSASGTSTFQAVNATDIDCATLDTTGDVSVGGNFAVASGITFNDINARDVIASRNISAGGTMSVSGASTLDSLTASSGTFTGSVDCQAGVGTTTLTATGLVTAVDVTMSGTSTCLNKVVNGTLNVSGVSTLGQLDAQATSASSLSVSGSSSLQGLTATTITASGAVQVDSLTSSKDVVVSGNLIVNGTTTTINSDEKHIADPVLSLGDSSVSSVKDTGIKMAYNDGAAKLGFMGLDVSDGKFMVMADATDSSEVFSGTLGDFKCGNLSADGLELGGNIQAENLVVDFDTTMNTFTTQSGSVSGSLGVTGAMTCSDTLSVTNALTGSTANFSTSLETPLVKTDTLTSDNASILVNKNIDATGFDFNAKEVFCTDDINAVNAVLSGDASATNFTATTNVSGAKGLFDNIDSIGAVSITMDKPVVGSSANFSGQVDTGSVVSSGDVSTSTKILTDTIDSNGGASISVSKPLNTGAHNITTTGQVNAGSSLVSGVAKAGTLKAPILTTDATEISVTKPLNLNANKISTTGQIEGDTGVFTTSISAPHLTIDDIQTDDIQTNTITNKDNSDVKFNCPVDFQAHALSSTSSISGGTLVASTSVSTPLLTSATTSISVNKDVAMGSKNLTTTGGVSCGTATASTKVDTPLIDNSAGTDIKLNKDLNFQAFNMTGTGDISTTGKVECGELNILSASTDTILASSTTTDSLVINGNTFTPSNQQITTLKIQDVEAISSNITMGKSDGTQTIDIVGTLLNNGSAIGGAVADLNDIANVNTGAVTLQDGVLLKYNGTNWVSHDNVLLKTNLQVESGNLTFEGVSQQIQSENEIALVDNMCKAGNQVGDATTDLDVNGQFKVDKTNDKVICTSNLHVDIIKPTGSNLDIEMPDSILKPHIVLSSGSITAGGTLSGTLGVYAAQGQEVVTDYLKGYHLTGSRERISVEDDIQISNIIARDGETHIYVGDHDETKSVDIKGTLLNNGVALPLWNITSPSDTQMLKYDSSTSRWVNTADITADNINASTRVIVPEARVINTINCASSCVMLEGVNDTTATCENIVLATNQIRDQTSNLVVESATQSNLLLVDKVNDAVRTTGEFTANKFRCQQNGTALSISSNDIAIDFEGLTYKTFTLNAGSDINSLTLSNVVTGLQGIVYIRASSGMKVSGSLSGVRKNFTSDISLASGEFCVMTITSDGNNSFCSASKFS